MKTTKLLQVNIDKNIDDKLQNISSNQGRTVSEIVREAIVKIILIHVVTIVCKFDHRLYYPVAPQS
jgi:antitoxin component of RelBE/YafQ-DinJ toxin-antitoxin module